MSIVKQFAEIATSDEREYEFYGVRCHNGTPVAIGDTLPPSYVWDDGECTDQQLDGTCAIDLRESNADALIKSYGYAGEPIIIAGFYASHGEDRGEIIIRDAVRIA